MNPAKDKIILGSLAIASFLSLYCFIIKISPNIPDEPTGYIGLVGSFLAALNIVILGGWLSLGWVGGAIILTGSAILVMLLANVYQLPIFYLNILIFIITAFTSQKLTKGLSNSTQLYTVDIERFEEQKNSLNVGLEKHRAQNDSLKKKLARYLALKDVTELFSGSLSLDDTIKFIIERGHQLISKAERTLFYLVDSHNQELVLKDSSQPTHFSKIKYKKGDVFDKWVLRQKQPLVVLDADKDFRFSPEETRTREFPFKSLISYPLIAEKRILGLVHMDSRKPDSFTPDDLRLLGIISDLGAVAIENAMLYQKTNELAIKDSLTDLFVQRYFKERIDAELERAHLGNYSIALLMCDIDHFKDYNDKYGHTAGDILLKRLADILNSSINAGDLISRYGGEEFAILLFETNRKEALDIAEKIRQKIESEKFWLRREETRATISIGIATFPVDAKIKNELIEAADRNLYKAKREGRNRVC